MFKQLLSVITITILTTLIATPSYSDDVQINLDPTTPYVDVPVTVSEPVDATVQTVTGTPDNDFIDSWIEIWQDTTRLVYNDDGAHSATDYLASIINIPLLAGEYFIRATSYNFIAYGGLPTGSYLLSTNLIVVTPSPEPTVSPEPSPTQTESVQPSPEPSVSETSSSPTPIPSSSETAVDVTPQPSSPSQSQSDTHGQASYPVVQVVPTPEPSLPSPEVLLESLEPEPSPTLDVQDTLEEVVDSSPSVSPSSLYYEPYEQIPTPSLNVYESVSILGIDINLPPILSETAQQIFESISSSLETISNLGSEFTPQEREQAQQVVLGAIIVTQLSSVRRTK